MENNNPEVSFRAGTVRASVFANVQENEQGQKQKSYRVVIDKRYKDKEGKWKSTNGFYSNEVPKAILVLQKGFEYLAMKENEAAGNGRSTKEERIDEG